MQSNCNSTSSQKSENNTHFNTKNVFESNIVFFMFCRILEDMTKNPICLLVYHVYNSEYPTTINLLAEEKNDILTVKYTF